MDAVSEAIVSHSLDIGSGLFCPWLVRADQVAGPLWTGPPSVACLEKKRLHQRSGQSHQLALWRMLSLQGVSGGGPKSVEGRVRESVRSRYARSYQSGMSAGNEIGQEFLENDVVAIQCQPYQPLHVLNAKLHPCVGTVG
jgi:hypothetical protein